MARSSFLVCQFGHIFSTVRFAAVARSFLHCFFCRGLQLASCVKCTKLFFNSCFHSWVPLPSEDRNSSFQVTTYGKILAIIGLCRQSSVAKTLWDLRQPTFSVRIPRGSADGRQLGRVWGAGKCSSNQRSAVTLWSEPIAHRIRGLIVTSRYAALPATTLLVKGMQLHMNSKT